MKVFNDKAAALAYLKSQGLRRNYSRSGRQYWWFGDSTDAGLDYSATLDKCGQQYAVCEYDRREPLTDPVEIAKFKEFCDYRGYKHSL